MKRLNRTAAQLIQHPSMDGAVRACTDITGFALLGHSYEMAEKSGVQLRFSLEKLPFLDGALEYADQWLFPAGTCSNERAYQDHVTFAPEVVEEVQQLLYTPETSGGLLVAVPPEVLEVLLALFAEAGHPCWVVGEVVEGEGVQVVA
jgi:selenide,water dikinase